jgi:hypothetical protein
MCRIPNPNFDEDALISAFEGNPTEDCSDDHEGMKQAAKAAEPEWLFCFVCGIRLFLETDENPRRSA